MNSLLQQRQAEQTLERANSVVNQWLHMKRDPLLFSSQATARICRAFDSLGQGSSEGHVLKHKGKYIWEKTN